MKKTHIGWMLQIDIIETREVELSPLSHTHKAIFND